MLLKESMALSYYLCIPACYSYRRRMRKTVYLSVVWWEAPSATSCLSPHGGEVFASSLRCPCPSAQRSLRW